MKASIFVSIVATLLIGCATADPSTKANSAGTLASRLGGTWQALEIVDTDPAGKVSHPYGEHPVGYIVYDATGHLHVALPARHHAGRPHWLNLNMSMNMSMNMNMKMSMNTEAKSRQKIFSE